MKSGKNPKYVFFGELFTGKRILGRSQLRYRDVCKLCKEVLNIDTDKWEELDMDLSKWKIYLLVVMYQTQNPDPAQFEFYF